MELVARIDAARAAYRDDVAAWADAQVALLRAGRLGDADIEHIIEEVESVGNSDRFGITSQLDRIIVHLLKLIYSPAVDPRRGWDESIREARSQIDYHLESSPSLRRELPAMIEKATQRAGHRTANVLADYGEIDRAGRDRVLAHRFTAEQLLGDWFPDSEGRP